VWIKPIFMSTRSVAATDRRGALDAEGFTAPLRASQEIAPSPAKRAAKSLLRFLAGLRAGARPDLHRILRHAEREGETALLGVLRVETAAHMRCLHARGLGGKLGAGNDGELRLAGEA